MAAQTRILASLAALLCTYTSVHGAERCSGFRHLENGRTFFRYSGLLVIFHCHPGYKLHGYQTNSCMSGRWTREPPVCVGSGCSSPGPLLHGTSRLNEDGSWVEFSCNSGYRLHGPSALYCKGHTWNTTKPVCKESDMMLSAQKPNTPLQNLQAAVVLKNQQQSHYDALSNTHSKQVYLKPSLSHISHSEEVKVVHTLQHKAHLQRGIEGSMRLRSRGPDEGTAAGSVAKMSIEETEVDSTQASRMPLSPTTTASQVSTVSSSSLPSRGNPSMAEGPGKRGSAWDSTQGQQSGSGGEEELMGTPLLDPGQTTTEPPDLRSTGLQQAYTSQYTSSTPTSLTPSTSFSISSHHSTTQSNVNTQTDVPSPSTERRPYWTEYHNIMKDTTAKPSTPSFTLSRRPVCRYPPVPTHGTFYFRNVENPGPREYRHYIQYACYPGYTLAHGDIRSYCLQGGLWSGVTPVCLELTPCFVNNGGCSQLCSPSHHPSYNQTETRTRCHCRPGFSLLEDRRTCRDVDECVEGQHRCQQKCINTFGSFKCGCNEGYHLAPDRTSCTDVDECLLPDAVTGCVFGCVNTPGSFHCQCPPGYSLQTTDGHCQDIDECTDNQGLGPCAEQCHNLPGFYRCSCIYGHVLAGDGRSCIPQCPPGYRILPPTATTPQALRGCVDINECQEQTQRDRCGWQCVNLPGSHRCICPRGYTLQRDGKHCKDINECSRGNGGCSYRCVNHNGGHKCACPASHRISPYSWKTCVPRKPPNTAGLEGLGVRPD